MMLTESFNKTLLLISLVFIELAIITSVVIGLDHFIYPIIVATILLYVALPAIEAIEKHFHIPKIVAIFLIFSLQVSLIIYILFSLLPSLIADAQNLLQSLPSNLKKSLIQIDSVASENGINLFPDIPDIESFGLDNIKKNLKIDRENILRTLTVAQSTAGQLISPIYWLIDLLLIPILFFFLGLNYQKILRAVVIYTPSVYKAHVKRLMKKVNTIFAGYIRGQVILITILTISYCIGFSLIELPHAIIIGLVTGIMSFIPYLGTTIGIITSLINLSAINSPTLSYISLFLVFAIVHGTESVVLIPNLIGNSVGLNVFTSFLSILIGANYFGVMGILFAIPFTAILKHIFQELAVVYKQEEVL